MRRVLEAGAIAQVDTGCLPCRQQTWYGSLANHVVSPSPPGIILSTKPEVSPGVTRGERGWEGECLRGKEILHLGCMGADLQLTWDWSPAPPNYLYAIKCDLRGTKEILGVSWLENLAENWQWRPQTSWTLLGRFPFLAKGVFAREGFEECSRLDYSELDNQWQVSLEEEGHKVREVPKRQHRKKPDKRPLSQRYF